MPFSPRCSYVLTVFPGCLFFLWTAGKRPERAGKAAVTPLDVVEAHVLLCCTLCIVTGVATQVREHFTTTTGVSPSGPKSGVRGYWCLVCVWFVHGRHQDRGAVPCAFTNTLQRQCCLSLCLLFSLWDGSQDQSAGSLSLAHVSFSSARSYGSSQCRRRCFRATASAGEFVEAPRPCEHDAAVHATRTARAPDPPCLLCTCKPPHMERLRGHGRRVPACGPACAQEATLPWL